MLRNTTKLIAFISMLIISPLALASTWSNEIEYDKVIYIEYDEDSSGTGYAGARIQDGTIASCKWLRVAKTHNNYEGIIRGLELVLLNNRSFKARYTTAGSDICYVSALHLIR